MLTITDVTDNRCMEANTSDLQYVVNWRRRHDTDGNTLCNLFFLLVLSVTCLLFIFQVPSCCVDSETSWVHFSQMFQYDDSSVMIE